MNEDRNEHLRLVVEFEGTSQRKLVDEDDRWKESKKRSAAISQKEDGGSKDKKWLRDEAYH